MQITRRFTREGQDPFAGLNFVPRSSVIRNPNGSVVFEMKDVLVPEKWSQVAVDILRDHGNAIDAAIALAATIAVTNPDWAGPAGDSAWLIYIARTGEFHFLDGYSTCPARMNSDLIRRHFGLDDGRDARAFQEEPPERRHTGVITGMVPGTPAAWVELSKRFGQLPLGRLLDPAIAIAESGFPINRYLARALQEHEKKTTPFDSSRRVICTEAGRVLAEGETLRQIDLAWTLQQLAEYGHDGFYSGKVADAIVDYCRGRGGVITHDDLREYRAVWRRVVTGSYRGRGIVVSPPPTAGVHVIEALNILEGFDLSGLPYHGGQSLHLLIEALKFALADRRVMGGDPDFLAMDVVPLVDKGYAAELRKKLNPRRAARGGAGEFPGNATTHFAVVDDIGNMVSATQTVGASFGCGEVVAGTGMFMNDRSWWMSLGNGPNRVAPKHRANIGHAPTILLENGRPLATIGSPGGFGIVQYVVQVIVNLLDYGLDLQTAIEAPRFKLENLDGRVGIEKRVNEAARSALAAKGHEVFDFPQWTDRVGGVAGIFVDPVSGNLLGGYDPRRNAIAVGLG